ncbi:heterokaryon incompatibility protein-domain-containing protein [Pyrenochaeta sp. MPI-SDFR-AT-0127]|nr:heterokaryon incompatibility protein-domain-containing protein [Pyrenochaeta sp. MPI-SDFR-AT-0127]
MRLRSIISHVRITQSLPFFLGHYKYEPLPSPTCIRLLELLPSTGATAIRCSLKTFELQDAPSFKALSYTWGHSTTAIKASATIAKEPKILSNTHQEGEGRYDSDPEAAGRTRRHSIICDGRLVKVTSNLRDALRMLANAINMPQMPKTPSYYWIDALCMNQSDIEERNIQVARMADVFKKADGVICWLGKEDEFTNDALTTIRRISAIPESDWPLVPYTSFYDPEESQLGYSSHLTFHNWLGFMVLINRPWFKRAWVVQEIALGKSALVVCGSKVFSWDMLSKTLSFVKTTKWYHHLHTEKMKHVKALQKHPGIYKRVLQSKLSVGISPVYLNETRLAVSASTDPNSLESIRPPPLRILLDKHRFSKSSDPRDKVYAFLGLANRALSPFRTAPLTLTPNYNLSVQEVYIEAARAFIVSYENLSWLSHVEDPSKRRTLGLPSWVPDLTVPLDPYPLRFRGPGFWKASGNKRWVPDESNLAKGILKVQGYQLDHIDQTSVLLNESQDPSATWASIVKLALSLESSYPDPEQSGKNPSRIEVLWRTLTTDIYAHAYPAPIEAGSLFIDYILNLQIRHRLMPWSSADEFQPHHSPLSESIYPEWRTLLKLEPPDSPYCLQKYTQRLTAVVESMFNGTYSPIGLAQLQHELDQSGGKNRRLFKTRGGFMGTGPRSLRSGDEVWILHRGGLPFVLRPQPSGHYHLIGDSFVYGVMHGEVLKMNLPQQNITIV